MSSAAAADTFARPQSSVTMAICGFSRERRRRAKKKGENGGRGRFTLRMQISDRLGFDFRKRVGQLQFREEGGISWIGGDDERC